MRWYHRPCPVDTLSLYMLPSRIKPVFNPIKAGITQLIWPFPPRNIFIAKKAYDKKVLDSSREFIQHLVSTYPVNILTEPETKHELQLPFVKEVEDPQVLANHMDLIVSLGGDGTILRAVSLMKSQSQVVPPVLSFSMGTLGFLLPFNYKDSKEAFRNVYESRALVTKRSRLRVSTPNSSVVLRALNEAAIHRGHSPHLAELEISVNGQHLTTAIADGIAVSTPTGSTAYSLSAGGSIVHPGVECMLLTPICPRSLSFRPLVLPQDAHVSIRIAKNARGASCLSLDGDNCLELARGDTVSVEINPDEGVWCVTKGSETDDWVGHINGLLGFNSKFGNKGNLYKM